MPLSMSREPITSTSDPGVTDDADTKGARRGDLWINTSDNSVWICADPAVGAAVWREVSMVGSESATFGAITGGDSSLGITGQAAAQGGAVAITGGTSSTAGNLGGAVTVTGGTPGATSVGGAVTLTAGAGGATSGAGAVASLVGGAGTAGNSAGGVSKVVGGAGQGSAAGGDAQVTGGAGGATGAGGAVTVTGGAGGATSGTGGAVTIAGGAGTNGNANGGAVILTPGAKHGTGLDGNLILRTGAIWYKQSAATTDNADTPYTLTAAEMLGGISSMTPTTGRAVTTLTGAQIDAAVATAGLAADDAFEFSVQNRAAFAATDDIITLTAGASGVTVTGSAVISPGSTARFRARRTGAATYVIHKIAG